MKNITLLRTMVLIVLSLVMSILILSGCSQKTETMQRESSNLLSETTIGESKLAGKVIIDGSGTVYPLMDSIAKEYMSNVRPDVIVEVGRAGSSAGFKRFIPGETDFSNASRKIKEEETAELNKNGIEYMELKLALDGLTIVINKENTWAEEMTKDEIINVYLSGKYKADDKVLWSDVREDWPQEEIKFYGPNENHGTYEFFFEKILDEQEMVKTANLQQEYSTLIELVTNDKNAIAFFGFGYYIKNKDKLKAVKVDFGNGPVEPTIETIGEDLPYAGFTRPVYTYLNVNYAKEKPQVLDYAKFVVSTEGAKKLAGENGFAPLPDSTYVEYQEQLKNLK